MKSLKKALKTRAKALGLSGYAKKAFVTGAIHLSELKLRPKKKRRKRA